jgi:hypothetical protein
VRVLADGGEDDAGARTGGADDDGWIESCGWGRREEGLGSPFGYELVDFLRWSAREGPCVSWRFESASREVQRLTGRRCQASSSETKIKTHLLAQLDKVPTARLALSPALGVRANDEEDEENLEHGTEWIVLVRRFKVPPRDLTARQARRELAQAVERVVERVEDVGQRRGRGSRKGGGHHGRKRSKQPLVKALVYAKGCGEAGGEEGGRTARRENAFGVPDVRLRSLPEIPFFSLHFILAPA